jgi:DNA-binding CsgD family transcriptional regulator/tetratricopeptide (TPR) repeat protein
VVLFGRESEQAQLARLLEAGGDGPSALLLEGAPGIGKSSLWRDAVQRARGRGWRVAASVPGKPDRELAFAGLGDLFDGIAEESLAELPGPQQRALSAALYLTDAAAAPADPDVLPRAVLGAVRRLALGGRLLVAIDDEQWLDAPSRRILGFVLSRLRAEPVCLLISRRSGSDDSVWSALDRISWSQHASSIALEPLDETAIARLIADRRDATTSRPTVRRIYEASGGNPLYALAIARELFRRRDTPPDQVPIPATLIDAISDRLAGVAAEAQEPLLVAAACTDASPALIESVLPEFTMADLDGAIDDDIIELIGDRVRFTHPLLASAVYSLATPARRRTIHRRLAMAFAQSGEEHAHHLALSVAVPDEPIATVIEQAAGAAAKRGAPEVGAVLVEHAARLTPADAVDALRSRRVTAAELHFASGDQARARSILESILDELPGGPIRARALLRLAKVRFDSFQVATDLAEQALSEAGSDHRLAAQTELLLGELYVNRGDQTAAKQHALAATDHAERLGDPGLLAQTLGFTGLTAFFAGDGVQEELMARAVSLERAADEITSYYTPSCSLGNQLFWSDQLARARPLLERSLQRAIRRGEENDRHGILFHLAHLEWESGQHDAAEQHTAEFIDATDQQIDEQAESYLLWLQAFIAHRRGDLAEATRRGEQAVEVADRIGDAFIHSFASSILAAVELIRGDPRRAHERLPPIRAALLADGRGFVGSLTLGLWTTDIEALILTEQLDAAADTLDEMRRRTSSSGNPNAVALEQRCRGLLQAARGETEEAIDSLELALAQHARRPMPLELGRTLLELGTVQRRARRKSAANRTLEQALAMLEPLEASLLVARARDELGRVGLRRATPAVGLTPAQTRVAELVISGLTNREIAATLYMSTRTVETHLTKIYREFGIRSRSQLASVMPNRGAPDTVM